HRHPQAFSKFPGQSSFSRSRPACDDDALWFSAHVSGRTTPRFSSSTTRLNKEARLGRRRSKRGLGILVAFWSREVIEDAKQIAIRIGCGELVKTPGL